MKISTTIEKLKSLQKFAGEEVFIYDEEESSSSILLYDFRVDFLKMEGSSELISVVRPNKSFARTVKKTELRYW